MNKISNEEIMRYVRKHYDYLISLYDTNRILGVFAQGKVNFGFAEKIEDIQVVGCYIPTFEDLCTQLNDMEISVKEDVENESLRDEDMFRINEKIKDLEKQILNVIEG